MTPADSSDLNSADIMQQIREQTSNLETGEPQEETITEEFEVQGETEEQPVEEQPVETVQAEAETEQVSEAQAAAEEALRIKYKGKDVDIPSEKIKEYVQKGYRMEERERELREKEKSLMAQQQPQQVDYNKINEDFVKQLQENPVATLMQFTKMVNETTEQERKQQRKMDKALEKDMAANIPHWDAIQDAYRDYRDEGYDPKMSLALSEADFWKYLALESKQKGVQEGEKKTILKQKAIIPGGNKKGASLNESPSVKDIGNMTSSDLAKSLGLKYVKHPDW
jgi:hypothetical protein